MIRSSWLNRCVGVAALSGLFALSAISQAEVITWDTASSPLNQGWIAGSDGTQATITFANGVATVDTEDTAPGARGLYYTTSAFDEFVFEFSIKLNNYSSTQTNACWLEPMVTGTLNGIAHQFRPHLCMEGANSQVINNTSNGTGATAFTLNVQPHESDFHIYRYEGSISQSTYSLSIDGQPVSSGGMLARPLGFSAEWPNFFSVGDDSDRFSANYDVNGMCFATDGDDCSLSTTPAVTYSVSATAGTGGSASCSETSVESGGSSTCTATPDTGYEFDSWTGACAEQGATCSLTNITSDQTSAASFTEESSTDNGDSDDGNGSAATPVPSLPFYMLMLLSGLLSLFGVRSIRR